MLALLSGVPRLPEWARGFADIVEPAAGATGDVDAAVARAIAAVARVVTPVHRNPWGQRAGYLTDLSGVPVEIGTPLNDAADPPAPVAEP